MEYDKTEDPIRVMKIHGHKNINNTLVYTHLMGFQDDEYTSKVAGTVEADGLVEAGFEYVCNIDDARTFRKRK